MQFTVHIAYIYKSLKELLKLKKIGGVSPVAQWKRICLPMQEIGVGSLV